MASMLEGSLAKTLTSALLSAKLFMDATLTREVPGVSIDPADPVAPTIQTFACKAIQVEYATGLLGRDLVNDVDVNVLILTNTLATEPRHGDRITIRGLTVQIVPAGTSGMKAVTADPARATWSCRCS